MGSRVARQCSENRCLTRWTVWIPHRGRRGGTGQANSKNDLVTGPIRGSCALHDAHSIFRHAVDQRRVFCAGCAHSEFIHSDDGSRRCLYSECKCSAWRGPGERDDPITTILPAEVDDGGVDIAEGIDAPGKLVVKKIQAVEGIT